MKQKKKKKKKKKETKRARMRFAIFLIVSLATFVAIQIGVRGESVHEHFVAEHAKLRRSLSLDEVESRFDADHVDDSDHHHHHHHRHGCRVDNDDPQRDRKNCTKKSDESAILEIDDDSIHHSFRKRYLGNPSAACIESVCDVPDIARGYLKSLQDDRLKDAGVVMRVVTFTTDESQSPHVSKTDTSSQSFILNQGFLPVGVFFSVVSENIASTYKWSKQVVGDIATFDRCRFDASENDKCDKACDSEEFGYDHGDCLCPDQSKCGTDSTTSCRCLKGATPVELATPAYCNGAAASNNRCDVVCNLLAFDWDHGECCTPNSRFCYDPQYPIDSMQSSFVSIAEAISFVQPRESELTSLIMPFTLSDQTLGLAALPQRPPRTVPHGLFLANSARNAWGQHLDASAKKRYGVTAFHEIMHIFGLLHTHQNYDQSPGNVKRDICEQACVETTPSMVAGDFCDDTPPTPENRLCQDPEPCSQTAKGQWCSDCQSRVWRGTNFANVMGYAPDECIYGAAAAAFGARGNNSRSTGYQVRILQSGIQNGYLTPLQAARARCFYDARWTNLWALQKAPSVVPVPPRVSVGAGGLVGLTIEWLFPVYLGNGSSISFTIEREPAFEGTNGGAVNLPAFAVSGLPSEQNELPKVPLGVDYFYTGFKIGDVPLNFGHYRDKTAKAAQSYRYRVRAGGAGDLSLSWSDWSEQGRADGGGGLRGQLQRARRVQQWRVPVQRRLEQARSAVPHGGRVRRWRRHRLRGERGRRRQVPGEVSRLHRRGPRARRLPGAGNGRLQVPD
jgi:hypothetical protein